MSDRCNNLYPFVAYLATLSLINQIDSVLWNPRKDSEQTKQIEELQKQNEELTDEKERLLEEIERIIADTGKI